MKEAASDSRQQLEEYRELACQYFRQGRHGFVGGFILGVPAAWLVSSLFDSAYAWLWLLVLGLITVVAIRLCEVHGSLVTSFGLAELTHVENLHALLTGLAGLCWGMLPWLGYQGPEPALDNVTGTLVVGMSASTATTLAAFRKCAPAFILSAMLPFAVKAFQLGGKVFFTGAVLLVFGAFLISFFSQAVHRILAESIRLRHENLRLVGQLREEKKAVEEASRVKSLFLAGVSHDLKHPLNAMGLYLGYLKTQRSEAEAAAGVARTLPGMEQALGGMGRLLSRLLELSKLEAGEYHPQIEDASMQYVFQRSATQFAGAASAKDLRLHFRATRAVLKGDYVLLQSILDNLVGNALRYTEQGGVVVGMRKRNGVWVLQVVDSGPGIPAERIPLLFEAYRRFDDTQRNGEGYGLGLALVKKQCELLGYRIQVKSRVGRGSVFSVVIG